ncbi:MAG: GPR endopeptidase [Clostridia bacterium]|nr:GPR endopeptidase [Clostridia bacterium]
MSIRTDLALEKHEIHKNNLPKGVEIREYKNGSSIATEIIITDNEGAEVIGKPKGKYITLEGDGILDNDESFQESAAMLSDMLSRLIPESGTVLVAGLGNTDITADAIGPLSANGVIATRHIPESTKEKTGLPFLRDVAVISPGVTGKTGVETGEIIAGIKEKIKPSAIIIIDALASRSVKRLGRTVQLSDTGISPGSGVGNRRNEISEKTMGVPVIAIGIPTVVDAATLAFDLTGKESTDSEFSEMMVTPKDTDMLVSKGAGLIALSINRALQKNLSYEEIMALSLP